MESIKIEGKDTREGAIINYYLGKGKVIGTVFGERAGVEQDLGEYAGKDYKYIYYVCGKLHVVRIIDTQA